jgi:hypothetical protein
MSDAIAMINTDLTRREVVDGRNRMHIGNLPVPS